jgi:hypothetical protein
MMDIKLINGGNNYLYHLSVQNIMKFGESVLSAMLSGRHESEKDENGYFIVRDRDP